MTCVIVEGPDGAGKTTLINSLAETMNAVWFHNGAYLHEDQIAQHYFGQLYYSLINLTRPVILDRSWFAEPIYGAAMRSGSNRISELERMHLEKLAMKASAVVILCLPPFEVCQRAWASRVVEGKEYLDREEKLKDVHFRYLRLRTGLLPLHQYDYTKDTVADVCAFIERNNRMRNH